MANFNKTKIDGVYIIENILLSEKDKKHPSLKELDLSEYSDFNICPKEV